MAHVIVEEQYQDDINENDMKEAAKKIDEVLEKHGAAWKRTYRSTELRREICEFEAPSVAAVREAYDAAGSKPERIYVAQVADEAARDWH